MYFAALVISLLKFRLAITYINIDIEGASYILDTEQLQKSLAIPLHNSLH
jgi:hypothetical protein